MLPVSGLVGLSPKFMNGWLLSYTLGREALQAVNNFLRLNVATFNTLLLVFQPELERVTVNRDKPINPTEYISAVGRRMLPALRLYSKWLLVSHEKLHNTLDDNEKSVQTKQLWQTYANTLSLLAATFDVEQLPRLDYLLEEDEDLLGFLPLAGALKGDEHTIEYPVERLLPKLDKEKVHPNEEQLSRVLLLLEDGLTLCSNPSAPIAVVDGAITYQEDGLNTSILPSSSPAGLDSLYRPVGTEQGYPDMPSEMLPVPPQVERPVSLMVGPGGGSVVGSVAPSESASVMVAMNRMVDSLVGPRGGAVSEEDEDDVVEEVVKSRAMENKEILLEEEEILFVGRKGRLSGAFKPSMPKPKTEMWRRESGNPSNTPPISLKASDQEEALCDRVMLDLNTYELEMPDTASTVEPGFKVQSPQLPSPLLQLNNTTTEAITTRTYTPQSSAVAPLLPTKTYTASDLVKQLRSYSSQVNPSAMSRSP